MLVLGHGDDREGNRLNSLESIDVVRATGADGIECDVRRTADDVVVVAHDDVLADGQRVAATRWRELPSEVPRLEEVLDRSEGLLVNVEVKNFERDAAFDPTEGVTRLVCELLARRDGRDDAIVSCFGPAALDLVHAEAPRLTTAMLLLSRRPPDELLDAVVAHGHRVVHPYDTMVDGAFMRAARDRSLVVNVWFATSPHESRLRELVALDVDGVITDAPATALKVIGR